MTIQRILVIDDHPLIRKGMRQLSELDPGMQIVGEADGGEAGIALARELNPDLILLDLNMKGMDGLETLAALKALDLDARVVMLTVSDAEEDVVTALRAGADGYLLKDMEPEELLERLQQSAAGRLAISPRLTELLARALRQEPVARAPADAHLTEREAQTLRLLAAGMSNKLIAREMGIAEATVKVHVKHLLKKLGLKSRVEAAVWAVDHDLR
jgi:two-component system nitrate/nitrite response regulator NarL